MASVWRVFAMVALAISVTALNISCDKAPAATGGGLQTVRVSLQPIPAYAPLWVAKRQGWLEKALKAQSVGSVQWFVIRDGPLQNEAFAASSLDVALMGDTPAIIGRSAGLDTRIVSMASVSPRSLAILVPRDSTIASAADLKGKKVGVTKGSFCHHLLALALKNAGLGLNDIKFINMSAPEINTSLETGAIDAGATWEPYISQLLQKGSFRVLLDGTRIKRGDEVIVATAALGKSHSEVIRTLLDVYARGAAFIKESPDAAAKLIATDVGMTPEQVLAVFAKTDYASGLRPADLKDFAESESFLRSLGITRSEVAIPTLVDEQFSTTRP